MSILIEEFKVKSIYSNNNNFLCFPTKFHFLGFKFYSKDSHDKFLKILLCDTEQNIKKYDINIKSRDFKCTYKDIIKVIKDIKTDFEKKTKDIDNFSGNAKNEKDKAKTSSFQLKYKKFNIFIDKTFNPKIIQTYTDIYKNIKKKLFKYKNNI